MSKWADFVVAAVKYNREHSHIVGAEIRADTGETISGTYQRLDREDVIAKIRRGTSFVTAYQQDGKWHKGEDLRVVAIHGESFIRTDENATKKDNLGSLPEYE
jgi:hypothetical protein